MANFINEWAKRRWLEKAVLPLTLPEPQPAADPNPDPEWDLHGLVCDQIDRANPLESIETRQAIARNIIQLVRSRDG